jgi:hypothetical protein
MLPDFCKILYIHAIISFFMAESKLKRKEEYEVAVEKEIGKELKPAA